MAERRQRLRQQLGGVLVVVHQQHAAPLRASPRPRRRRGHLGRRRHVARRRQLDDALGAAAMPLAVQRHRAAVGLDQAPHDGQPQPEAALGSIAALPLLGEGVEQVRQQLGGDADARCRGRSSAHGARPRRSACTKMMPPGSVYFAALVSRFATTCARRLLSPSTYRSDGHVDMEAVPALLDRAGSPVRSPSPPRRPAARARASARSCRG